MEVLAHLVLAGFMWTDGQGITRFVVIAVRSHSLLDCPLKPCCSHVGEVQGKEPAFRAWQQVHPPHYSLILSPSFLCILAALETPSRSMSRAASYRKKRSKQFQFADSVGQEPGQGSGGVRTLQERQASRKEQGYAPL
eukprot:1161547-Pelagomonas_calceolata.AAC.9